MEASMYRSFQKHRTFRGTTNTKQSYLISQQRDLKLQSIKALTLSATILLTFFQLLTMMDLEAMEKCYLRASLQFVELPKGAKMTNLTA